MPPYNMAIANKLEKEFLWLLKKNFSSSSSINFFIPYILVDASGWVVSDVSFGIMGGFGSFNIRPPHPNDPVGIDLTPTPIPAVNLRIHTYNKTFNKKKVKLSYSCMSNVANLINKSSTKIPLNAIALIKPLALLKVKCECIVYKVGVYCCRPNNSNISSNDLKK